MGDRVAVMRKGELQQVADPQTLYDQPVNLFVGGFIGSPAMNMLEATLERQNGGLVGEGRLAVDRARATRRSPRTRRSAASTGKDVVLGIRPEDLEDVALAGDTPDGRRLKGKVELTEALGSEIMVHFSIDAKHAVTDEVRELAEDVGDDRSRCSPTDAAETATLVGRFGARSRVRGGERRRGRGRHARTALLRPEDGSRHLRRNNRRKEPHREKPLGTRRRDHGARSGGGRDSPQAGAVTRTAWRARSRRPHRTRASRARSTSTASGRRRPVRSSSRT